MEQMEQSGLCWGDYLVKVMSSVECCAYEGIHTFYDTKYLWKTRGLLLSSSSLYDSGGTE